MARKKGPTIAGQPRVETARASSSNALRRSIVRHVLASDSCRAFCVQAPDGT